MSHPLVSETSRRFTLVFALAALTALPSMAEARPSRSRPAAANPAVEALPASENVGDFLQWLVAELLGIPVETVFLPIVQRSETDSEIEVDPPNPVVRPEASGSVPRALR